VNTPRTLRPQTSRSSQRTQVVCGLDEAGLGPLLGPLTIGYSAFEVPRSEADPWKLLKRVCARKQGKQRRIVVADSKQVFSRNPRGFKRLERTALSFTGLGEREGRPPKSARAFLFGPLSPTAGWIDRHPWYAELPQLPRVHEAGTIELATAALQREFDLQGMSFLTSGVRLMPAGELNASLEATGNKGETVWQQVSTVLRHLWNRFAEQDPEITVDVLGGRMRYGGLLARSFPETAVEIVREEPEHSAYVLCERDEAEGTRWFPRRMRVAFRVKGEDHSFAVALASCLAKYAREIAMEAFNAHFAGLQQDLRPTAGYRGDAQRWLEDARTAIEASRIDPELLIRRR